MSDVRELHDLARHVQDLATQTRAAASQMREAQGVDFVSDAAERYRAELRHQAHNADGAARELDDAARALIHHADEVADRLREIAKVEHFFSGLLSSARHEVAGAVHAAGDAVGDAERSARDAASRVVDLARRAPPPGSPDWLEFGRRLLP
jgi:methyl-accepting chemotaxis protein